MPRRKPKTVLFVAVALQTALVGALLSLAIPYYLWGPAPTDETALQAYSEQAAGIVRLIAALWAGILCVAYYLCFVREDQRRPPAGDG